MINIVKSPKFFYLIFLIVLTGFSSFYFSTPDKKPAEKIKDIYLQGLTHLQKDIRQFEFACLRQKSVKELQQFFYSCRITYKKFSILSDFFNPYETRLLNGPAIKRSEDDNPQVIIDPQGFQALEETLFRSPVKKSRESILIQLRNISKTIQLLQEEPNLQYKFSDDLIFSAFRSALIRLAAMGISGFDSPVAHFSLPEAMATLDGISNCIRQYKQEIQKKNVLLYKKAITQISAARSFIASNNSFDKLDRLTFLKQYINPLFGLVTEIRNILGIELSTGRMPVNQKSTNIFDAGFFNIDFFSPNERYQLTPERIELGRQLFFDPIMSGTKKRSCATCHKPELAFTDQLPTALAIDEKTFLSRNTPTLWNSVFQTRQFFDSRTSTLENQLSDVVHNRNEMKGSLQENITQIRHDSHYSPLFKEAYKDDKEPVTQYNIANAIASYIRSLVALNSRFDQYMRGDENKMSTIEKRGFNLFMGKGKCGTCHYLPLFNGLVPPDFNETESEVLGVPQKNDSLHPVLDPDAGKFNFTLSPVHRFAFKTPVLRNIELTAPYMHNGVFNTLEEVMDFYNKGGGSGLKIAPETQTLPPDKLNLSEKEINAIVSFLKTLTDTSTAH